MPFYGNKILLIRVTKKIYTVLWNKNFHFVTNIIMQRIFKYPLNHHSVLKRNKLYFIFRIVLFSLKLI